MTNFFQVARQRRATVLIGWHVNNGKDQAADFFPAAKFRDIYYRPDIIQKVLQSLDENGAIRLANAELAAKNQRVPQATDAQSVLQKLLPVVTILSPQDGATFNTGEVLTGGRQTPITVVPPTMPDFPIVVRK